MRKTGIYIHIPFCKRKCFYCHFVKYEYNSTLVKKYIDALVKEIQLNSNPDYVIDSIYIGGGSPSLLNERQVSAIIGSVYENFKMNKTVECTIEMNPEDVSEDKLRFLKENRINRLSIGAQSFLQKDLDYLQRTHTGNQSLKAIQQALAVGFNNINVDFIISLPLQTKETLEDNFSILKDYEIPHISAYILEGVEEGENKDTRDNELYFFTKDVLERQGYIHYEVSNFSKPGFQSKYNLKYWKNKNYIGIGLSASGYEDGVDYRNTGEFDDYFEKINDNTLPGSEANPTAPALRKIVMGLRLLEGISNAHFTNYRQELEFLLSNGFLIRQKDKIAVNPGKILLLNEILGYF